MAEGKGIWARFISAIRVFLSGGEVKEQTLRDSASQMMQNLELQANAASFAMARADEVRKTLRDELDNHESLRREAEEFLKQGDEVSARRLVTLQIQSQEKVAKLKEEYEALQLEAEQKVTAFRKSEEDVNKRVQALPKLEQEAQILREEERLQKALSKFNLQSPQNEFDRVEREIEIKRRQLQNRNLLTADPNAELDMKIKQAVGERKIENAMDALKKKVLESSVIDAEYTEAGAEDVVSAAQKALEAPRYQNLALPQGDSRAAQGVPVRKDTHTP